MVVLVDVMAAVEEEDVINMKNSKKQIMKKEINQKVVMLENLISATEAFQLKTFLFQKERKWLNPTDTRFDDFNTIKLQMHRRYGHTSMIVGFIKNKILDSSIKDKNIIIFISTAIMRHAFLDQLLKELPSKYKRSILVKSELIYIKNKNIKIHILNAMASLEQLKGMDCEYVFVDAASAIRIDNIEKIKKVIYPIANYRQRNQQTFVCSFLG